VTRRIGATWIAGVVLPLVLGGLILMHTVDLAPAEATSPSEHAAVDGADAVELHGGHDHGCDGCHLGLHMTAVCVAVLGSIAVWRLARHIAGDTSTMDSSSSAAERPSPPPLLRSGRPPWVALGVMRC
jgi:hypothetical protein